MLHAVYKLICLLFVTCVSACLILYMYIFITLFCFVSKIMFIFVTSILEPIFLIN